MPYIKMPFLTQPVLSLAQCFGEEIQVQALTPTQLKYAGSNFRRVSVSVWYDSVISEVAGAIDGLHAMGCAVDVKRHADRPGANPYRLSYFDRPWFYADFASRVRDGLRGHLLPGDSIEIANEPAYGATDGLVYADNSEVWLDLFAGIAWDDRAAFRGVEIRGPLPNGMQPEVVTDILASVNLSEASFAAFDTVTAHVYPDNASLNVATGNLATRIGKLGAFSKWTNKPVRISECGCDGRLGAPLVINWIRALMAAASFNGILSVDWWASVAPFDGFSLDVLNNPMFISAITGKTSTP